MKKVQAALNEYFNQNGFYRSLMNLDFLLYGFGLAFQIIGIFQFVGSTIFSALGLILFLAGIVFALGKSDEIGLIIALAGFALLQAVGFILSFIGIFNQFVGAAALPGMFASLFLGTLPVIFLICVIHRLPSYVRYKERKRAEAAAYAAAAAQAAYNAQAAYGQTGGGTSCAACGYPVAPGTAFCPKCGAKQEPHVKKACAVCGAELSPDAMFCVKCGTKV